MLRRVAPILFIGSGVAGLLMQVAWFRLLALSLGGTLTAATVVLSVFMAGLALGSWLIARHAAGFARPLRTYGVLELAAGLLAFATIPALGLLDDVVALIGPRLGADSMALLAVKVLLAALVLLPATTAMGGTLPVLCQGLVSHPEGGGLRVGGLYALNAWGAVAGALLAIFIIVPRWGLSAAVGAGAVIDLCVGLIVLALWRDAADERASSIPPLMPDRSLAPGLGTIDVRRAKLVRLLTATLFITGAAGLAYEILWTRALSFYFGSGAHGFSIMLAVVLTGLSVGAFLGGSLADRQRQPLIVLALSQVLMGAAIVWQVWRMPALPDFLYQLALRAGGLVTFRELTALLLLGAVQVLLPAAVLMGAALPVAVRALLKEGESSGRLVGRLYSANSLGTIIGAVLATWLLVPTIGLSRSLFVVASVNVLIGLLVALRLVGTERRLALAAGATMAALLGVAAFAIPPGRVFEGSGVFTDDQGRSSLIELEESAHGTVTLSAMDDSRGHWLSLSVDAVNVAGTAPSLLACQTMQGQLPLLLHRAPRSVVHVGFGSGGTAAAVASHREIESIDIVEINPAILRISDRSLRAVNGGVLEDPRVRVHLQDGRNWLLATDHRFDCILSDSIHPRYRGNSSLYTVEYFELCRSRLNPGGLVSTWLPIYSLSDESLRSIVAAMREVFPNTSVWYLNSTVNEFVILVGRTDEGGLSVLRMNEVFADPESAESLRRVGVIGAGDVLDYFIGEGESLGTLAQRTRRNCDDLPWVELESAAVMDRDQSWRSNLLQVVNARSSVIPHLDGASQSLVDEMMRREPATGLMLRAHLALLARDKASLDSFAHQALAANPAEREPWDFFGPPEWVRPFVMGERQ